MGAAKRVLCPETGDLWMPFALRKARQIQIISATTSIFVMVTVDHVSALW